MPYLSIQSARKVRAGAAVVGGLAIGFHALVALTGSLFLAMTVHFVYDVVAGIVYIRLAPQMPTAPATA